MKILIIALILSLSNLSYAQNVPTWSTIFSCPATSSGAAPITDPSSNILMINAGMIRGKTPESLIMMATGGLNICLAMDQSCEIGPNLDITDTVDAGQGLCYAFVQSGDKWVTQPHAAYARWQNGLRNGTNAGCAMASWCDARLATSGGTYFPPCDNDATCTSTWGLSGSTCTPYSQLSQEQLANLGLVVICESQADSAVDIHITKEIIQR